MPLLADEETSVRIEKDGISYILESRSVSSVVRFIYTPIDGTLADLELEINSTAPLLPADGGGILVEMGGTTWPAQSEEIERRLVSCEQVGACVEARWQWKHGDELADFLYRFSIQGKSLILELEGGGGKATGVDAGWVSGASHGRLVEIPYLVLGRGTPRVLCSGGVFISSFIDWRATQASTLHAPTEAEGHGPGFRLNGGCSYTARTDGRRCSLHERLLITVSRHVEEVIPQWATDQRPIRDELRERLWYNVPSIAPSEEGYVSLFEQLREFRSWGLESVLVNHPDDVWHDGDGNATFHLDGASMKGGDDALAEYLEAIGEMGFAHSLPVNFVGMSANHPAWDPQLAAQLPDGTPAPAGPGQYRLRLDRALEMASKHTAALVAKYKPTAVYVTRHASEPPWEFVDHASGRPGAARLTHSWEIQRLILAQQLAAHQGPVIGDGGMHWLYPNLLHGHLARMSGFAPSHQPLLVDPALRWMHVGQVNAGVGTPEQFFGDALRDGDRGSRTAALDRFVATTVAYGHAGLLPDPATWGLPSTIKVYYMLRQLQTCYLGVPVRSVRYHHDGNLLDVTEALLSGGYLASQLVITYENGLTIHVNGSWDESWEVEHGREKLVLPPASFLAVMPDGPCVYSADTGSGRIDVSRCAEYLYCDTRWQRTQIGPLTLQGAALLLQRDWEIDILPVECEGEIAVDVAQLWPGRRLPPLRLLAFRPEEEEAEPVRASSAKGRLVFEPTEAYRRYRITLPEWMVEPGR